MLEAAGACLHPYVHHHHSKGRMQAAADRLEARSSLHGERLQALQRAVITSTTERAPALAALQASLAHVRASISSNSTAGSNSTIGANSDTTRSYGSSPCKLSRTSSDASSASSVAGKKCLDAAAREEQGKLKPLQLIDNALYDCAAGCIPEMSCGDQSEKTAGQLQGHVGHSVEGPSNKANLPIEPPTASGEQKQAKIQHTSVVQGAASLLGTRTNLQLTSKWNLNARH